MAPALISPPSRRLATSTILVASQRTRCSISRSVSSAGICAAFTLPTVEVECAGCLREEKSRVP